MPNHNVTRPEWLLNSGDLEKDCQDAVLSIQALLNTVGSPKPTITQTPIIMIEKTEMVKLKHFEILEVHRLRYAIKNKRISYYRKGNHFLVNYKEARGFLDKKGR